MSRRTGGPSTSVAAVLLWMWMASGTSAWVVGHRPRHSRGWSLVRLSTLGSDDLMDMDVVIYSDPKEESKKLLKIGAIQEDGSLAPLSAWSDDPAFGDSIEFVVDEEDRFPGIAVEDVRLIRRVPPESLSYGSRQVGGGKGPGNPHGEESELLYYVTQDMLEDVEIVINPELEILW